MSKNASIRVIHNIIGNRYHTAHWYLLFYNLLYKPNCHFPLSTDATQKFLNQTGT